VHRLIISPRARTVDEMLQVMDKAGRELIGKV
jgi:hypothetical protein